MRTNTAARILELLQKKQRLRVHDLVRELTFSQVAVHKQLNKLVQLGKVTKIGKPPLVFYALSPVEMAPVSIASANTRSFIDKNYLYVSPRGEFLSGWNGFVSWCRDIRLESQISQLAAEYRKQREEANSHLNKRGLLDGTAKIRSTFKEIYLHELFYHDFYSLPKFGKTKLGHLVLLAKQSQRIDIIRQVISASEPQIQEIVRDHKLQAVFLVPPTIPRKLQLMKEFSALKLSVPVFTFQKQYRDVPVAQKSLNRLSERILNVQETLLLPANTPQFTKVLVIDDAIGSGATLNEAARKLREQAGIKQVIGYAIVGSYKGFDVIREI